MPTGRFPSGAEGDPRVEDAQRPERRRLWAAAALLRSELETSEASDSVLIDAWKYLTHMEFVMRDGPEKKGRFLLSRRAVPPPSPGARLQLQGLQ